MKNPTRPLITRATLIATASHNTRWFAGVVAGSMMFSSAALSAEWLGASSDWNDVNNWNPAAVPGAGVNANINTATPNFPILTANALADPANVVIGLGAGTSQRVDIRSGRLIVTTRVTVGDDGGSGILNVADTSVPVSDPAKFTPWGPSGDGLKLQVGERLYVGGVGSPAGPATGVMNVNTTGTITVAGHIIVGEGHTTGGTLNVDSGTITTTGGEMWIGQAAGGVGRLNMSNGTINVNNNWVAFGRNGGTGFLTMTGGAINKAGGGDFLMGTDPGGNATIELHGGSINVTGGVVGVGDRNNTGAAPGTPGTALGTLRFPVGSTATLTANGGNMVVGRHRNGQGGTGVLEMNSATATVTLPGTRQLFVGNLGGAKGTVNMTAGTINANDWIAVGRESATGDFNMSGGTVNKTGGGSVAIGALGTNSKGTVNLSGGLFNVQSGSFLLGESGTTSQGTLTLSGTGELRVGTLGVATAGGSTGIANLDGGTFRGQVIDGGAGNASVDFNGTQIIATANRSDFINDIDNARIEAGNLRVDSAGFTLSTVQALLPPLAGASGGVVKSGAGTLNLNGANTYSGASTVEAGALNVTTATTGGGAYTVNSGATLGVTQALDTDVFNVSDLTLQNGSVLNLSLANAAGNPAAALVNVTGTLSTTGTVTINLTDPAPSTSTPLRLVSYAAGSGANFVLGTVPEGVVASLVDAGGLVSLNVTRINSPHWTGDNGAGGDSTAAWNTTDSFWQDAYTLAPTTFADGDPAIFEDLTLTPTEYDVTLDVPVTPGSTGVTFDNALGDFTLTGSGKISGTKGLTKRGSAALTIGNLLNDFTGPAVLEGGTTSVGLLADTGSPSPLGAGNLVLAGGTLDYTGPADVIGSGFSIAAGTGVSTLASANALEFQGAITSTGGGLHKAGAGDLTLSSNGPNVIGGAGVASEVRAGKLILSGAGSQTVSIPGSLFVATVPDVVGNLTLTNTAVTIGNFFVAGRGNGDNGVSNIALTNSSLTAGGFTTGFANANPNNLSEQFLTLDNSTITSTGVAYLAESAGATATLTMSNNSQFNAGGVFILGRFGTTSSGTLTLNDSSKVMKTAGTHISIGGEGAGTATLNGTSEISTSGGDFNVADVGSSVGVLTLNGESTVTSGGPIFVGKGASTNGSVVIGGDATMTGTSYISVGFNGTGSMTLEGDGSFSNTDDFSVNEASTAPATVTVQDTASLTTGGNFYIGRNGGTTGTLSVSGTLATVDQTNAAANFRVGLAGTGTLNISETAVVTVAANSGVVLGNDGAGTGTVNLNGGTLVGKRVFGGAGTSTFNFHGGLLRAGAAATADFFSGVDNAFVKANGAFIDSNGQSIAVNQPLLTDAVSTGGGLNKSGTGALRLNGVNTYTGPTTVAAGSLGGTGTIVSPITVQSGAALEPGAITGTLTASQGVTFSAGSAFIVNIDDSLAADNGRLDTTGTLDVTNAALQVNVTGTAGAAPYTIATAGTVTGPFASVPAGVSVVYNANSITITPPAASPFQSWIAGFSVGGLNQPGDDADFDGLTNLQEFALDGNPASGASTGKVRSRVETVSGEQALVITLPVRVGATFDNNPGPGADATVVADDLTYLIKGSNDLANFDQGVTEIAESSAGMPPISDLAKWGYRTFRLNGAIPARGTKGFLTVDIQDPTP